MAMMKVSSLALLAGAANAGELALSWSDCGDGSTHGKITDVQPSTITTGQADTITSSGTVDEDVTGGTFSLSVKTDSSWFPITLLTETADICSPKTMTLKGLGVSVGTVSWAGLKCPVAKGALSMPMTLQLSSSIPTSLASTVLQATAVATNGDKLACLSAKTAPAAAAVAVPAPWVAEALRSKAGELALSWSDCGDSSTHGKITALQPTTITTGQADTITSSGTMDEVVTGGTFSLSVTTDSSWFPITLLSDTGDICSPKTMNLKGLGVTVGTVSWAGLKCPVAKGALSMPMTLQLSSSIPTSLASTVLKATAVATNGDKLVCLSAKTAPAAADVMV